MKHLILWAGLALPSAAVGQSLHNFIIDDYEYQMIESSVSSKVSNKTVFITALWEVRSARHSFRWKVVTNGCDRPIGSIAIFSGSDTFTYDWSWDGSRAYDLMAASACLAHLIGKKEKTY